VLETVAMGMPANPYRDRLARLPDPAMRNQIQGNNLNQTTVFDVIKFDGSGTIS
jgi:hypothetical protein